MRVEQTTWTQGAGWAPSAPGNLGAAAHLALVFGDTAVLRDARLLATVLSAYPHAHVLGCSTAGEIAGTHVFDGALVVTAVQFAHATVDGARVSVDGHDSSFQAGERLAGALEPRDLVHVLVLSDGLHVNGTALVRGLTERLPGGVTVSGGLSGDGPRFSETFVLWNAPPERQMIAALGFYGPGLAVGCGSLGGWDPFGPERVITKSTGRVLYELDGHPALDLYKRYLGEHAGGLPATGLLFPLSLRMQDGEAGVVRTILSVDETQGSLTFAGDVPEGAYARLMKANVDRLIDGAVGAAHASSVALPVRAPELALLISCVGRRLVFKQRIEEEIEGVRDVLGADTPIAGFYSYGEIGPFTPGAACELHNQTMTITTLAETDAAPATGAAASAATEPASR